MHPGGDGDARTRQLMTRENKLALVVGFGLILLVGILISDHFSDGRNRESASLHRAIDPLAPPPPGSPDLIAVANEAGRPGVAPAPAGDRTPVGRWGAVLAARHDDRPNAVRARPAGHRTDRVGALGLPPPSPDSARDPAVSRAIPRRVRTPKRTPTVRPDRWVYAHGWSER